MISGSGPAAKTREGVSQATLPWGSIRGITAGFYMIMVITVMLIMVMLIMVTTLVQ